MTYISRLLQTSMATDSLDEDLLANPLGQHEGSGLLSRLPGFKFWFFYLLAKPSSPSYIMLLCLCFPNSKWNSDATSLRGLI